MKDYHELVRRSIRKDFAKANFARNGRAPKVPHPLNTKRIVSIGEKSTYFEFRRYIVGRLVRLVNNTGGGGWYEFVNDADRVALNAAAGWSNNKRQYFFDAVKFD